MTKLIVDSATGAKLAGARKPLELCDDSGHVLGHFIPAADESRFSPLDPQISEEELDRREREGGGRALADILADLEKRA